MGNVSGVTNNTASNGANPANTTASASSLNQDLLDFQRTLQTMMMASSMGSSGLASTGSDSSAGLSSLMGSSNSNGMGMAMMLPMMFQMIEKLLTKQMELLQSGQAAPTAVPEAAASNTTPAKPTYFIPGTTSAAPSGTVPANSSLPAGHDSPSGEPAKGVLTQGYKSTHNGLDIGIVTGTAVHSTMNGKVTYAGWSPIGYGNLVIVQNGDYQTYYAHLSKIPVAVGDTVQAGSTIGLSGSTGNSTGPHLHYEIRVKGKNIDPTSLTLGKSI